MNNIKRHDKWNNFLIELGQLLFFWFVGVLFFFAYRGIFMLLFHKQMDDATGFGEVLKVIMMGFRFDTSMVTYFVLLPLLSLLILAGFDLFKIIRAIRIVFQYVFAILSTTIAVVTFNYYKEYNDQFNSFLFLTLYDDQKAVFKTILEDFNPMLNIFSLLLVVLLLIFIFRFFEKRQFIFKLLQQVNFKGSRVVLAILTLVVSFGSVRGSFTRVPAMRKWSAVSADDFLNKIVINPFRSLHYAVKDFKKINSLDTKNPFVSDEKYRGENLIASITKQAKGATIEKPKQIFLVVMESYDSWPLMEEYLFLQLSSNLANIASEGTHFNYFIPASKSTFNSFATITSNVPYCGINVSRLGKVNGSPVTSIFSQFKKLGYETNLFYGGFLSWQNIGEFTSHLGVDRRFSGANAGGKTDSGDWGVEDEKLFDLVLEHTDTTKYSLNVILTTSYHAPYSIDLDEKGFPYKSDSDLPSEGIKHFDNGMTMEEMGHLWYSDKVIGDFMKIAKSHYPMGLFCFTGDHYGRRFINHQPNLYERSSVPFIMYGKGIPKGVNTTPGSHVDILPTLMELIAPKDFEYYSFGTSLFDENKNIGIGYEKVISPSKLYYFQKTQNDEFNLPNQIDILPTLDELLEKYKETMALSWEYTVNYNRANK